MQERRKIFSVWAIKVRLMMAVKGSLNARHRLHTSEEAQARVKMSFPEANGEFPSQTRATHTVTRRRSKESLDARRVCVWNASQHHWKRKLILRHVDPRFVRKENSVSRRVILFQRRYFVLVLPQTLPTSSQRHISLLDTRDNNWFGFVNVTLKANVLKWAFELN